MSDAPKIDLPIQMWQQSWAPKVGEIWQHCKGNRYKVLHVGLFTEADPPLVSVVYCSVDGPATVWIRPLSGWPGAWLDVLPDGTQRFQKIEGEACYA